MSIIYDALKRIDNKKTSTDNKTQDASKIGGSGGNKPKIPWLRYFMAVLLLIAFSGLMREYLVKRNSRSKAPASSEQQVIKPGIVSLPQAASDKQASPSQKQLRGFSLTGIFFTEGEYIALINNEMVKLGDSINGFKIVGIGPQGVDVEHEGMTYRITTPKH